MKNFKRVLLFLSILACTPAFAQSIYSIKIHLSDEKTKEPVAFATVSVTLKGATTPMKYVLTDDKGNASIAKLKKGTYTLRAELMGYKTYTKEVALEKNVDLGTVKMLEDAEVLDAAKVTDIGNPIVVKKDTVEYNASSFKTSDNDMLEQLLKKLPGVEVAADGSITANGETIKKITIDGKTFFLDDPQLASKNIPAKIIEKVKVVEKKSDQALFTGIDDGEEETIIDLKLRPGMADKVKRLGGLSAEGAVHYEIADKYRAMMKETLGNFDFLQGDSATQVSTATGLALLGDYAGKRTAAKNICKKAGFERLYRLIDAMAMEVYSEERLKAITDIDMLPDMMDYVPTLDVSIHIGDGISNSRSFTLKALEALCSMDLNAEHYPMVRAYIGALGIPERAELIARLDERFSEKGKREA